MSHGRSPGAVASAVTSAACWSWPGVDDGQTDFIHHLIQSAGQRHRQRRLRLAAHRRPDADRVTLP